MDIETFRLSKDFAAIFEAKHTADCVVHQDGPCTCGLDEVLEDEMIEELGD